MRYGMVPDPEEPGGFRLRRKEPSAADDGSDAVPTTPTVPDRYSCSSCDAPIATELVVKIEAERRTGRGAALSTSGTTGFMLITHHCPCSPLVITTRRYRSYAAFVALFGRGVSLPYESPFRPADVAEDDPEMARWRWELEQTADAEDFLYWLEHNRPG